MKKPQSLPWRIGTPSSKSLTNNHKLLLNSIKCTASETQSYGTYNGVSQSMARLLIIAFQSEVHSPLLCYAVPQPGPCKLHFCSASRPQARSGQQEGWDWGWGQVEGGGELLFPVCSLVLGVSPHPRQFLPITEADSGLHFPNT